MRMTRERRIFTAVLALALAALGLDRLLFNGGPRAAQGAVVSTQARVPASPTRQGPPSQATPRAAAAPPSFLDVLQNHGSNLAGLRDAFSPRWVSAQAEPASERDDARQAAHRFARQHRLLAVMSDKAGGYAIINGRCIPLGREISGFRLVSLTPRSACLERDGVRVELALPDPAVAAAAP